MASIQMVVMCCYCGRYVRTKECEVPDGWAKVENQVSHGYCPGCECAVHAIHEAYHMSIDPHWQTAVAQVERLFIEKCKVIKGGGSDNHSHLRRDGDIARGVDALSGSHPPPSSFASGKQSQEVPENRVRCDSVAVEGRPFQQQSGSTNDNPEAPIHSADGQNHSTNLQQTAGDDVSAIVPATFNDKGRNDA